MPRRAVALLALTLVALAVGAAAASAAAPTARVVTVRVRPAIAGVPIVLHGSRHLTDATGRVQVLASARELANRGVLLRDRLRVPSAQLRPKLRVRFSRWIGRTASVVLLRPVRMDLIDPGGAPVSPRVAPRVFVRGTDGSHVEVPTGQVSWLPAVRAVVRPGGRWRERRISFAVQEVPSRGTNVVHRAQQRFVPDRDRQVAVRVLFFEARLHARDALLGNAVGTAVVLRFPDGHTERIALDQNAERVVAGLPRGDYLVKLTGPGIAFSRPVALSRSQDVALQLITWVDVAIGLAAVALGLLALAIARRRLIARSVLARMPAETERARG